MPLARHLMWYLPQSYSPDQESTKLGGGMGKWSSIYHIFHLRWCSNCRLVCGARLKLGLDAGWGWVPSHSVRGNVHSFPLTDKKRTRGRERTAEEDTTQERCRGVQSWPERCWSKRDPRILPVATQLRCNPWAEEGLMQGCCYGAGATWCNLHLILLGSCDALALHPRRSLKQEILLRCLP